MKNHKIRNLIILFFILVILLLVYMTMVFKYPSNEHSDMTRERFNSFYACPEDSLDAVFVGTSGAGRYWCAPLAWKEEGVTMYPLTTGSQPLYLIKYTIAEALRTHDIKTVVVDIRAVLQEPKAITDADIRRTTDNLRLSKNKIEATSAMLEYCSGIEDSRIDTDDISYYWNLVKYHSRWQYIHLQDFYKFYPTSKYMGYLAGRELSFETRVEEPTEVTSTTTELDPDVESVIVDLLDYCDTIDCNVVFVISPYSINKDAQMIINSAFNIIEDRGYDTYNFNTEEMYEELDWQFNGDLYNKGHANFKGCVKFTRYLTQLLKDKYGATDRRNNEDQSKYTAWNEAFDNVMLRLKQNDPEYYKEYMSEL